MSNPNETTKRIVAIALAVVAVVGLVAAALLLFTGSNGEAVAIVIGPAGVAVGGLAALLAGHSTPDTAPVAMSDQAAPAAMGGAGFQQPPG